MRLEMHAHDCEVSPCAVIKAKELVDGYKEAGYDGIVSIIRLIFAGMSWQKKRENV